MGDRFSLFFKLTKVDEAQRLVYGRATEEIPDHTREIMDYATSKPNFEKWSEAAKARTAALGPDGLSLGNVREMHQPIAAGKVTDITFNDAEKAIDVCTYCGDDNSWSKITKGVLAGFSVGGEYAKRWPDPYNPTFLRYTANPLELSYVDAPAVPTATFTMVKADGSEILVKVAQPDGIPAANNSNPAPDVPPPSSDINPSTPAVDKVASGLEINQMNAPGGFIAPDQINAQRAVVANPGPRANPVEKAWDELNAQVTALQTAARIQDSTLANLKAQLQLALVKASDDDKAKQEAKLKAVGARVGIARKDGEPLTPPKDYPTDPNDYGDPANWSWPYDTKTRTQSAMAYFNGGKGKDKYDSREWNILGRRIATRASKLFGKKYAYSPSAKQIEGQDKDSMQKINVMPLVAQVQQALEVAADQIGNDPVALKDLLMNVVANLDSAASSPETSSSTPSSSDLNPVSGSQASATPPTSLKAVAPTDGGGQANTPDTPTPPPGTGPTSAQTGTPASSTSASDVKSAATPPPTQPSTSSTTSSSPSTPPDPVVKELADKVDALTATVAKLAEFLTGGPVGKNLPVLNLNGLQKRAEINPDDKPKDPVLAALLSGDKYALRKAAAAAGEDGLTKVYDTAIEAAHQSLADSGVFSAYYARGGLMFNPTITSDPAPSGGQ